MTGDFHFCKCKLDVRKPNKSKDLRGSTVCHQKLCNGHTTKKSHGEFEVVGELSKVTKSAFRLVEFKEIIFFCEFFTLIVNNFVSYRRGAMREVLIERAKMQISLCFSRYIMWYLNKNRLFYKVFKIFVKISILFKNQSKRLQTSLWHQSMHFFLNSLPFASY